MAGNSFGQQLGVVGGDTSLGASIGSAGGPIGSAIGGAIGAIGGLATDIYGDISGAQQNAAAVNMASNGVAPFENINTNVGYAPVSGIPQSSYDTASQTGNNALGDALTQLQQKYNQGGLNATDISQSAAIQGQQLQGAAQARAAVQNEMQARGQSNSGTNYISQLVGGQQSAGEALKASQSQAALAEQAKMQESGQIAGIGNQLQQNAYQVAGANDAISQFNKGLQVSNSQNQTAAQEAQINAQLQQAGGLANVYSNEASLSAGGALANTQNIATIGTGLSGIPSAIQAATRGNAPTTGNSTPAPSVTQDYNTNDNQAAADAWGGYG